MADSKITALTSISTSSDPANDPLVIVDVSDTSMAATGTTKKVTLNQLLACSPTATLASATITGAATVGTTLGVTGVSTFAAGTALLPALTTTGDTNTGIYYPAADTFAVTTGGTERYRVDSAGNCGIGVTPSASDGTLRTLNVGYTGVMYGFAGTSEAAGFGSNYYYNSGWKYRQNGAATNLSTSSGKFVFSIASSGTAGNLVNGGSGVWTDAMTLDASGNLLLATTTNTPSARQYINQASGSNPALYIAGGASTTPLIDFNGAGRMRSDGQYLVMETTNASGVIYVTANTNGVYLAVGGTSWTANSDERLKDIIEPINNAVAKVGSLRSVIGKFKNDETNTRRSFLIAQDVQAVLPEAVDASNPDRLGVAYSEVIPLLVAAIKELAAEVNALKKA